MLAVLIYIANMARRTFRKIGRGLAIIGASFREAQEIRRTFPRVYVEE